MTDRRQRRLSSGEIQADTSRVLNTASELATAFDWPPEYHSLSILEAWTKASSGNHFFLLGSESDYPLVVLKFDTSHDAADTIDTTARTMNLFADALDEMPGDIHALRPVGWQASPPAIATPYVDGADLTELLRPMPSEPVIASQVLVLAARGAGSALAGFHGLPRGHDDDEVETVDRIAGRLGITGRARRSLASASQSPVRRFGDFGPGNVRLTPSEAIVVFDAPARAVLAQRERDIAYFCFQVHKILSGHGARRGFDSHPAPADIVCSAFVEGYVSNAPAVMADRPDPRLIALYQSYLAAVTARSRLRSRRIRDAAWAVGHMASQRRSAAAGLPK